MRKIPFLFAIVLTACLLPAAAFADDGADVLQPADAADALEAQSGNNASGTWGTCPWEISADGTLTVHPGDASGDPGWSGYKDRVTKVVFAAEDGRKVVADSCDSLLFDFSNVTSVDLTGLDTSKATSMTNMFCGCMALESLDVSGLDTSSATNMAGMFRGCKSLKSLDLSGFDMSNVTNMSSMFQFDTSLAFLDVSSFDTSNVTSMDCMFGSCSSLASVDVSRFDTFNVTRITSMFNGCSALTTLDLSSFDTSNIVDIYGLNFVFGKCSSLTTVYVGDGWSVEKAIELGDDMFYECQAIVGGNGTTFDASHVDGDYGRVDAPGTPGYLTYKGGSKADGTPMHRLYNPNSGEHFYTADENERLYLIEIGWAYEGIGWTAPTVSDWPVFRLYNRSAGDHHYTLDANERDYLVDVGWEYEGIGWYSADETGTPLYRQFNPNATGAGSHNYTADLNERDWLVNNGWNDEDIGWYGV